jgi:hypothetical protein
MHVLHLILTFFRWHSEIRDLFVRPLLARVDATTCLCPRLLGPIRSPQWSSWATYFAFIWFSFLFCCTRSFAFSIRVQSRSAFTVSRDTKPFRDIPAPLCFPLAVALFALSCCCAWPLAVPTLLLLLFTAVCALAMMGPCFLGRRPAGLGLCSCWKCRCLCRSGLCPAWACAGRGRAAAGCRHMAPGPAPCHESGAHQVPCPQCPQKPGVGSGLVSGRGRISQGACRPGPATELRHM